MRLFFNASASISSLGTEKESIKKSLSLSKNQIDPSAYSLVSKKTTPVWRVDTDLVDLPAHLSHFGSRNNRLLATTAVKIAPDIERIKSTYSSERIGVILGTSTSGIGEAEKSLAFSNQGTDQELLQLSESYRYSRQEMGDTSTFLSALFDIKGPSFTISTACTSSAKAILEAKRFIEAGICDAVICGGCDTLCDLTLNGFDSLDAISYDLSNPFSANRKGINIGEACALFIVSRENAKTELLGVGESSDGYHISSPEPQGKGAEMAIDQALKDAKLTPSDIGYINLHGTGTKANDSMESIVTHRVFSENTPCSSTKQRHGHTLGAAGALELSLCELLLNDTEMQIPFHVWDSLPDPELPLINLVSKPSLLQKKVCMSNNYAFGGSNVSIIIGSST